MNNPQTPNPAGQSEKPKRYWLWPGIIVGILSVHTIACLVVVYIATSDPTHAVIPNYHEKALAWDQQQAKVRASSALGWTCEIETALEADMLGERSVRISMKDAAGEPITGAAVKLQTYHHARSGDVVDAEFGEGAPGEYVAMVTMRKPGLWGFEITATLGEDIFTQTIDQYVGPRNQRTITVTVPK